MKVTKYENDRRQTILFYIYPYFILANLNIFLFEVATYSTYEQIHPP